MLLLSSSYIDILEFLLPGNSISFPLRHFYSFCRTGKLPLKIACDMTARPTVGSNGGVWRQQWAEVHSVEKGWHWPVDTGSSWLILKYHLTCRKNIPELCLGLRHFFSMSWDCSGHFAGYRDQFIRPGCLLEILFEENIDAFTCVYICGIKKCLK